MKTPGVRARKTDRTRRTIADAALKAFHAKGYDATTLEDVAEAAGVHKRTLLRYFHTKAHLVLDARYKAFEEFRADLAARGHEPVLTVWENHLVRWSQKVVERGPRANLAGIAAKEPTVRQALLAIEHDYAALLFEALWSERGRQADQEILCQVAASALAGANFAMGARLHAAKAYGDFIRQIRAVVALVRERLLTDA
jgi:AcrR family transcriptional regulator